MRSISFEKELKDACDHEAGRHKGQQVNWDITSKNVNATNLKGRIKTGE